jgi:outer membrane protein OmpA-like peptidoglycan-associated protein/uncharacterized protein YegL
MKRAILLSGFLMLFFQACLQTPFNYVPQPLYLNQQDFSSVSNMRTENQASLTISRVETEGRLVRLHVHLMDNNGNFFSGVQNNNTTWCNLINTFAGTAHPIRDFRVFEDRVQDDIPTAYALVLDHSGSMSGRVNDMQQAVIEFIRNKRPIDAISIVKYDATARIEVPLSTDVNFLLGSFRANGLQGYGGLTAIQNGIHEGVQSLLGSPYRRRIVISFTDGGDNRSTFTQQYVTWLAQSNNIQISTIDLGRSVNQNYMRSIAGQTGGTYNYMMYASEFPGVFTDIRNRLSHSYIIEFQSPGIGQHSVQLTACLPAGQLIANASYFNEPVSPIAPVRDAIPPKDVPRTDGKPFIPPRNPQFQSGTVRDLKGNQGGVKPNRGTAAQSGQIRDAKGNQGGVKPNRGANNQSSNVGGLKGDSRPSGNNQQQQNQVRSIKGGGTNTPNNSGGVRPGGNTAQNPNNQINTGRPSNNQNTNTPVSEQGNVGRPGREPNQVSQPANQETTQQEGTIGRPPKQGSGNQVVSGANPQQNNASGTRPGQQTSMNAGNNQVANTGNTGRAPSNIPVFAANSRPTANSTFLLPVEFKLNSAEIITNNNINQILNQVAQSMVANPNLKLRITAHTDNALQAAQAMTVSNNRADNVRAQLVQRGVNQNRIETLGMGSAEPVADNSTAQGRAQNNRIVAFFYQ